MTMIPSTPGRAGLRALVAQVEAICGVADALLSPVEKREYASLLRQYILADEARRAEIREVLLELAEEWTGQAAGEFEEVDLDHWLDDVPGTESGEVAQAVESEVLRTRRFAVRLREMMAGRGLTQQALAEKLGLTQPAISQFVSGRHRPQPSTLQRLADALECSVADLWPEE